MDGNNNHTNVYEYDSQPFFTEDQYQDNTTLQMLQSIMQQPPVKKISVDQSGINKFTQTEIQDENDLQEQDRIKERIKEMYTLETL